MSNCLVCQLNHAALGVELNDGVLYRELRGSLHFLRLRGGSIAFSAKLWDPHFGEISRVQCLDLDSGVVYHADWKEFARHAFRRTLDVRAGEQIILPIVHWSKIDTRTGAGDGSDLKEVADSDENAITAEQLSFDLPRLASARRRRG